MPSQKNATCTKTCLQSPCDQTVLQRSGQRYTLGNTTFQEVSWRPVAAVKYDGISMHLQPKVEEQQLLVK